MPIDADGIMITPFSWWLGYGPDSNQHDEKITAKQAIYSCELKLFASLPAVQIVFQSSTKSVLDNLKFIVLLVVRWQK